jgi:hypothetical protein
MDKQDVTPELKPRQEFRAVTYNSPQGFPSAELSQTVYLHPDAVVQFRRRRASRSRAELLTLLRGQLTLLRMRAERGIPVSVDALARTEQVARILESQEIAA